MEQTRPPLHDVITLGSLFGTAPKPELLDLAVRLAHADSCTENVHVIARAPKSVGPTSNQAEADEHSKNIVRLHWPVPHQQKVAQR